MMRGEDGVSWSEESDGLKRQGGWAVRLQRAQCILNMGHLRILSEADVRSVLDTTIALDLARRTLIDQAAGPSLVSAPPAMTPDAPPAGGQQFKLSLEHIRPRRST